MKDDVICVEYYIGDIATRNVDEVYLEENFGIPFKTKTLYRKEKMYVYHDCLVTPEQKTAMEKERKNVRWKSLDPITIFEYYKVGCDGASYNNGNKDPNKPQFGSYGLIVTMNNHTLKEKYYAEQDWTNNIGELTGAIKAIEEAIYLSNHIENSDDILTITILSDSQYVVKGCTEWMEGWIARGWRNNENKPTPNKHLWEKMKSYLDDETLDIRFRWVRGHTKFDDFDSTINEQCDKLATKAIKLILEQKGVA